MNYTNFNRHENMSSETVSEVLNITTNLMFFKGDAACDLQNYLYGLLDGYLYEGIPVLVKELEPKEKYANKDFVNVEKTKEDILRIWKECTTYSHD